MAQSSHESPDPEATAWSRIPEARTTRSPIRRTWISRKPREKLRKAEGSEKKAGPAGRGRGEKMSSYTASAERRHQKWRKVAVDRP